MSYAFWLALTWLGDSALLLPAAAFIALWLASARATRLTALGWVLAFGLCGGIVLLSKVAFMGWGLGIASINFTGFSGHTAIAAAVWPVALWLLTSRAAHRVRVGAAVVGWMLAALVGYSRLAIDAHSVSEVAAGYLLGAATSAAFLRWQQRRPHPRLGAVVVGLSLILPVVLSTPGHPAPTHNLLMIASARLAGNTRPYTRADLHQGTHPPRRVASEAARGG